MALVNRKSRSHYVIVWASTASLRVCCLTKGATINAQLLMNTQRSYVCMSSYSIVKGPKLALTGSEAEQLSLH